MANGRKDGFDPAEFLAKGALGRKTVAVRAKKTFFVQGVVSKTGKEATLALLREGDFVGEDSLAGTPGLRLTTATAIADCSALRIERTEMIRAIHEEHFFSDFFLKFLLARSMRIQADLVDQLFNSSEKRLARILLLMAELGQPGELETVIPKISQGTTHSRVSFFMNRFRKLGFIKYNGGIRVNKSLLNVVLHT
jgi:CRP-like cAMP-binding protein